VTSCVFAPAANVALQKIKFAAAIKLNAVFVFMDEQRPRTALAQAFWRMGEYALWDGGEDRRLISLLSSRLRRLGHRS
jgi:hypothetical protein